MFTDDRHLYSVIGALVVEWGTIEKTVAGCIHNIESELALGRGIWPPPYTDLHTLRDFKGRKGHLRKLVEAHGLPDELKRLDEIFQTIVAPGKLRHSLCHDLVTVTATGDIGMVNFGNPAKGLPLETTWKKLDDLQQALKALLGLRRELMGITMQIMLRVNPASQNPP